MKIKELYTKHREIINYLIFGVLTTLVSWVVYFGILSAGTKLFGVASDPESPHYSASAIYAVRLVAQVLQWVAGVLFSFFTNRKWVFDAEEGSMLTQLVKFSGSRVLTFGLDTAVTFGMVAGLNALGFVGLTLPIVNYTVGADGIAKIVAAVLVVISNYVLSKLFVFKSASADGQSSAE